MADKIIIFSGKQYSGKDTIAKLFLAKLPDFRRCAMGDIIKLTYGKEKGLTYEEIEKYGGAAWEFLKSLDALIDGRFVLAERDLSLKFRGSRNQRILHLEYGTGKILSQE